MSERKQEILDAALAIADESGLQAVTMRAVAERVGVTAMALYGHVGDKEGLLDSMLGRLLAELPLPDPTEPWQERMEQLAGAVRTMARRHPGATALIFSRPSVTADAVRVVDAIYSALLDAGVPPAEVPRLERLVSTLVLGYAVSEASGRFSDRSPTRALRGQLAEGVLPAHGFLGPWLEAPVDWDEEFAEDLNDLLGLVNRLAGRS